MTLADETQSRYGASRLVELTNPNSPASTTLDSTRLGLASTDAQARFQSRVGVAFDLANARHVDVAVEVLL